MQPLLEEEDDVVAENLPHIITQQPTATNCQLPPPQRRRLGSLSAFQGPGSGPDPESEFGLRRMSTTTKPNQRSMSDPKIDGEGSASSANSTWVAVSSFLSRYLRRQPDEDEEEESFSPQELRKREQKARDRSEVAFRQMFEAIDQNGDGRVDLPELQRMMAGLGIDSRNTDAKTLLARLDRDGDGFVSFEDFRVDWLDRWTDPDDRRAMLLGLFKLFDVTGDGYIEPKEVKMVIMSIGEKVTSQEIDEMFKLFDKDGSGSIDQNEFIKAMLNHIDKFVPKGADLQRIKNEHARRCSRIKAIKHVESMRTLPAYVDKEDEGFCSTVKISSV